MVPLTSYLLASFGNQRGNYRPPTTRNLQIPSATTKPPFLHLHGQWPPGQHSSYPLGGLRFITTLPNISHNRPRTHGLVEAGPHRWHTIVPNCGPSLFRSSDVCTWAHHSPQLPRPCMHHVGPALSSLSSPSSSPSLLINRKKDSIYHHPCVHRRMGITHSKTMLCVVF